MATAKQIQYRMGQAKKKLTKLNKEVAAVKKKVKTLEGQLKRAKAAAKAKPKAKAKPRKKAPAKKKKKAPARKKKKRR
ncbi:MAG: hypothetical protein PVG99_04005 [Desulfobacteraceae bacterium]|jgi:hypothetical protein